MFFEGEEIVWDGKIGQWPFIQITKAKRDEKSKQGRETLLMNWETAKINLEM